MMNDKTKVKIPRSVSRGVVIILALLSAAFTYNFWRSVLLGVGVGTVSAALFSIFLTASLEPAKVMSFLHGYHNGKHAFLLLYIILVTTSFAATIGSLYHQMSSTIVKEDALAIQTSVYQSDIKAYSAVVDSLAKKIAQAKNARERAVFLKERDMWEKRLADAIKKYKDIAPQTTQKLAISAIASLIGVSMQDMSLAFLLVLAVLIEFTIILFAVHGWGRDEKELAAVSSSPFPESSIGVID